MKKVLIFIAVVLLQTTNMQAQVEPAAGNWKTWFITSGKDYRLSAPPSNKNEIEEVVLRQKKLDSAGWQQILYWNAGAPGYHWRKMMADIYITDTSNNAVLVMANMVLNVAMYDATIAAWDTKYAYKRPRPFAVDSRIKSLIVKPESPSYPCEYSVAAGAAVTIIAHFLPAMADSVNRMAQQLMNARVVSGVEFPSDARAGFELGKRIAEKEIAGTKDFAPKMEWDRKMPQGPGVWKGENPMFPLAGRNKTVVLDSGNEFRPGPPPDFAKDMLEMKNFKQNFRSMANAFFWASHDFWGSELDKKIFECNLHLDPPKAARLYAITAIGLYDGMVACWDAKYAYWGIRPNQYDTTFRPVLMITPPFPGYPSGHAAICGLMSELYSYFFPEEKNYYREQAKEGAESRFQAGIHFRTDNEVALDLGRKVAAKIIARVKADGADDQKLFARSEK